MRIRYMVGKATVPQPSLSGSLYRPRPIMPICIQGPSHFTVKDALLDTGSDDTVFPETLAPTLGLDLTQVAPHIIVLAGRGAILCRFVPVSLRITDGVRETYEWDAVVGFVPFRLHYPLLGYAGFLQFFDTEFRGADQEVVLQANRSYAGRRTP